MFHKLRSAPFECSLSAHMNVELISLDVFNVAGACGSTIHAQDILYCDRFRIISIQVIMLWSTAVASTKIFIRFLRLLILALLSVYLGTDVHVVYAASQLCTLNVHIHIKLCVEAIDVFSWGEAFVFKPPVESFKAWDANFGSCYFPDWHPWYYK